jgi:glutathione S-transferase
MAESYNLVYFDLKGRAEITRLLFSAAGQEYKETKLTHQEWPERKSDLPFKQIPALEVTDKDGKITVIAQSNAIERFVANKFNLLGKDDLERGRVDMINEHLVDLVNILIDCYRALKFNRPDKELKTGELEKVLDETAVNMLKQVEALFEANQRESSNSGFLVGDDLTYGDLKLVSTYDWFRNRRDEILDKLPLLKEHFNTVRSHPKLKDRFEISDKMKLTTLF